MEIEKYQFFLEMIKNFKSIYLAGGIENRSNPNSWRLVLIDFFNKNEVKGPIFNPVDDNQHVLHSSILGYKDDGSSYTLEELRKNDEVKMNLLVRQMELNDFNFINRSDLIIFYLDDSAGFGTYTEFRENCVKYKKPMIIIRNIARSDLHPWVEWRRHDALVNIKNAIEFKNLSELKLFFIKGFDFKE